MPTKNTKQCTIDASASAIAESDASSSPVPVIRGETLSHNLAHIDWLSFSYVPFREPDDFRNLRNSLDEYFEIPFDSWNYTDKQWCGYTNKVDLIVPSSRGETINLGLVAYGGDSQRDTVHVSLNGHACARIKDWNSAKEWGLTNFVKITRVDTAHDDFEGTTLSIEKAKSWHADGLFGINGRPPSARLIDDMGSGKGKTFYVGKRANGKMLRIYEKGKQEGDPNSPWCRAEVEFRNQSRVIPWDIVTKPGDYLSGAYPCLTYLSKHQEKIKSIQRASKINYEAMVSWLKTSAGKSINAMLLAEQGDIQSVFSQISREGFPKRLEQFPDLPHLKESHDNENIKP